MASLSVTPFIFENQQVRTLIKNGNLWFVAQDVCDALKITNSREAIAKLDDDEKDVALSDTLGGKQKVNIINESGMYFLTIRCRDAVKKGTLPHRFRKWVTSEVLHSIRKTGSYIGRKKSISLNQFIICPCCQKPANVLSTEKLNRHRIEVLAICSSIRCPEQAFKIEIYFSHYLQEEAGIRVGKVMMLRG
ncbi:MULTISPECIES: BRO-N domain-containing protein [unclassified Photorhabdus]|uniref:BRO-N domain-containing protein n=1 Tax=unclassified Photorhabdus TaxID=2620880 RepID=UPI000DCDB5B6|nr:hypothetical protein CKY05_14560 [Photorhabdus sp. S10-54]RAW97066.1 hypothetical protein CKY03_14240 [Photorhabdus sp. S9-53]RAX01571.1 hypothetical protein CKY04_14210 [Photorhabdus sp. S8-52]